MSPDDIFAAQMWPWPDPLIKRDNSGRILFLNAAFLNIYGGRVEDWQGNVVSGWPAPQGGPTPTRFETRIPSTQGEIIYDWIEYTLTDGQVLAIARDVTAFAAPPTPPAGLPEMPPITETIATETPLTDTSALVEAQADELQPAQHYAEPPHATPEVAQTYVPQVEVPDIQAPEMQAPEIQNTPAIPVAQTAVIGAVAATTIMPAIQTAAHEASQPAMEAPQNIEAAPITDAPLDSILEKDAQDFIDPTPVSSTTNFEPETQAAPVQDDAPVVAETVSAQNAYEQDSPERDYERRALPIENDDAVLGNNWRDAVIAKAVGSTVEDNVSESHAAANESETPATQDMPSEEGGEAHRILLAEDNAINALLTRTLLEAEGCIVEVVEDGVLAVEAVKNNVYDMIFMDMRMPNMDGLEATRKIRAMDHRSKNLPIVALTANAFDDDRNACFDSGMNDFMTKPVSTEELSEMVKTWMEKRDQRLAS